MSNQLIQSNLKILITGKNSFIGKNYIQFSKYTNIKEVSLIDNKANEINYNGIDVIIHLVAIVHQKTSIPDDDYFKINHDLCIEVAKNAKEAGAKQFVYMSTVKVYGKYIDSLGSWNEDSICNPDDGYGKSKYAAEIDLKKLEDENFTVSIVRTPLVYGVNVKANMLSIIKLVQRFPILPLGGIKNKRSYTSVENLVSFLDRIIKKRASGVFIAKDEKAISTSELVKIIASNMGKKIILIKIPTLFVKLGIKIYPKIFERLYGSFEMENSKTLQKLDFIPPISIEEGISRMVKAYNKKKWK